MAVMTDRFASAAELMARVLGMPGYPIVIIEHPVSSASDDGLRDRARIALDEVRRMLLAPP
jgi:hypothetical protein